MCLRVIVIIMAISLYLHAQIAVQINSGDPVFPFPQFSPYCHSSDTLDNLATKNPVGVTHAEMEQTLRDAYQIMMNRAVKPGGGVGGKDYIKYLSSPQCSEGDGYGLLGAAAMADKETFDGMWLYIHDFTMNKVKRYSDCKETSPGYAYSHLPGWTGAGANSAADGDVDIALALLTAYLQWGEFMGIDDACGEPISYKKELIEFLKGLTDTLSYAASNNSTLICGDIGMDGYFKSGDSWNELTTWASDTSRSGFSKPPQHATAEEQHIDYAAPAYFRSFADFLSKEDSAKYAWNIKQFRRGEASADWLMGKMLGNEKTIPFAGWVELSNDTVPMFTSFVEGEDFRCAWRTILNDVWHGNPSYTWEPATHQIENGVKNSFELEIGKRYARFLWDQRQVPWNNKCIPNVGGDKTIGYWGPEILKHQYSPEGEPLGMFALNWIPGTGSPSAVVSQHYELMAELYRCLEVKWDSGSKERYLKSVPSYFHAWFRLLGLLVLTGNYQAPGKIQPSANMKAYCDVNRTVANLNATVEYTLSYRNYGSIDAHDVVIVDTLPAGISFVKCTGNGVIDNASNTVTWRIGTVQGFRSSSGIKPTEGTVTVECTINNTAKKQLHNRASITCSNGSGWLSNEYPNTVSAVLKRNYVDVISQPEGGLSDNLHGGRSGVHFSFEFSTDGDSSDTGKIKIRMFHDAQEAYIDYGNYRVSYFLYDTITTSLADPANGVLGWTFKTDSATGADPKNVKLLHEMLPAGENDHGKWNQRLIVQFAEPIDTICEERLWATNYFLDWYRGVPSMVHRGGLEPLFVTGTIQSTCEAKIRWNDDWSWNAGIKEDENSLGYPVTPDFTDPTIDNKGIVVDRLNPKQCNTAEKAIDNVLVEEWDGYIWRRVFGNAPKIPVSGKVVLKPPVKQMSINRISGSSMVFTLPAAENICLQVIDIQGRVISTLIQGHLEAGKHTVSLNRKIGASKMVIVRLASRHNVVLSRIMNIR